IDKLSYRAYAMYMYSDIDEQS
ncbi:hypothetical protein GJ496_004628, partial [Pomphorhynchus laevis]